MSGAGGADASGLYQLSSAGPGEVLVSLAGQPILTVDGLAAEVLVATCDRLERLGHGAAAQLLVGGMVLHHGMMLDRAAHDRAGHAQRRPGPGGPNVVRGPWLPDGAA